MNEQGSMSSGELKNLIQKVINDFCVEFVRDPYLCYTEHGLHALFFTRLYMALPKESRYFLWNGKKVCVIQKEYPTATKLDEELHHRPKRQHWDIAVIDTTNKDNESYDYFTLHSVIEFGLNEGEDHLRDDISRLSHKESNVRNRYLVHLYRISDKVSGRDKSPRSTKIWKRCDVKKCLQDEKSDSVTVFFGVVDQTNTHEQGFWLITKDVVEAKVTITSPISGDE